MNCVVTEESVSWKMQEAAEYMLPHSAELAAGWGQDNPTPGLVPRWNKQWINQE